MKIYGYSVHRLVSVFVILLIFANTFLVILPKLLLVLFVNQVLWGGVDLHNFAGAIAQDLLVAIVSLLLTVYLLKQPTRKRILLAFIANGFVVFLLLIDMRVREIWLQPLGISLLRYAAENARDLASGVDLFFNQRAFALGTLHLTFRRLLLFVGLIYLIIWIFISRFFVRNNQKSRLLKPYFLVVCFVPTVLVLLAVAIFSAPYRYRLNENILTATILSSFRNQFDSSPPLVKEQAAAFEQRVLPLSHQLSLDRQILKDVKPFQNLIILVYESIRWRGLNILGEGPTLSPVLAQLASEGSIVSKAYVSVPHSSKSYFAILSGCHPYPGIEMRELAQSRYETIWQQLINQRNTRNFAFSSLSLGFEGMSKELNSLGIREQYGTPELKIFGGEIDNSSSFGTSDKYLYTWGMQLLDKEKVRDNFVAIFFPSAAHYPYNCKDADPNRHAQSDYEKCVAETDINLGRIIDEFRRRNMLQDTLFVIIGDHGESFGEHGVFVHNSSMHDEEVAVPLILWSADKRLGNHQISYCRQIDIIPTIADLLGILNSPAPTQGVSLLRQVNNRPAAFMATFFDGLGAALYEYPYKYIFEPTTGTLKVFDHTNDPFEKINIDVAENQRVETIKRIQSFLAYQSLTFPVSQ